MIYDSEFTTSSDNGSKHPGTQQAARSTSWWRRSCWEWKENTELVIARLDIIEDAVMIYILAKYTYSLLQELEASFL